MPGRQVGLLLVMLALVGCPSSQSSRCKKLCQSQIECVEKLARDDVRIDETECTSACNALERDSDGKKLVDDFATCIASAAGDCEQILACR